MKSPLTHFQFPPAQKPYTGQLGRRTRAELRAARAAGRAPTKNLRPIVGAVGRPAELGPAPSELPTTPAPCETQSHALCAECWRRCGGWRGVWARERARPPGPQRGESPKAPRKRPAPSRPGPPAPARFSSPGLAPAQPAGKVAYMFFVSIDS